MKDNIDLRHMNKAIKIVNCQRSKTYKVNLTDQLCTLCPNGKFVDIKRHCHNIVRFLYSEYPYEDHSQASWFQLASGIMNVEYVSDIFDNDVMWCGPAIEYEQAKSHFHSNLITELTRFSFIWGGFESVIDSITYDEYKSGPIGKISRLNYFLSKNYLPKYPIPVGYAETVDFFKLLLNHTDGYEENASYFIPDKNCSGDIVGIKAVYKIRNLFAHGSLKFSEPEEYNYSKEHGLVRPLDIDIIQTSSRIVLLTLQMLLTSVSNHLNFIVTKQHEYLDDKGVDAYLFLQNMHLKTFKHS
ncbi:MULTISPECIES: hypothetical protein [unclassified Sphingobacterium]|uniref:hypothetical protein n=1 Tax=unclassified Sphingobacterium TaxID=2609468 RepID=UPI0025FFB167|nr:MULTISPECIES: hypothetical protein [unclassified Sphingobacterium]